MKKIPEKIVALDIGGVCVSLHPDRILKKLGLSPLFSPPKDFLSQCDRFERGEIPQEEWLDSFEDYVGKNKFPRHELVEIWNTMIGPDLPGMAQNIRELIPMGYKFVFFSNTSALHMTQVCRTCSFCNLVSGGVFSYEAGAMKPDPLIYEAFEKAHGKPAAYFDDRQENIDGALKRGWNAFLFESPEQFLSILKNI